jgi:hypothetical protein
MRRKIRRLNGRQIVSGFIRIGIAAAVMAAVCYPIYRLLFAVMGPRGFINQAVECLVPVAVGGATFFMIANLLGVEELNKLLNIFKKRFGRGKPA